MCFQLLQLECGIASSNIGEGGGEKKKVKDV
jgi:hypothetical protein